MRYNGYENDGDEDFLYELKDSLVTETEMEFLECIEEVLPRGCQVQAQANLASFIARTDGARFQNELFRNVDFIILDMDYRPLVVIEINDKTHLREDRKKRDRKVADICEEAGIPIITLWTSYGVNRDYIKKRIKEALSSLPVERIHHFEIRTENENTQQNEKKNEKKNGCYIATCVYGSYDCPQVWVLRRFRDQSLRKSVPGRIFIKVYYAISPVLVKAFGNQKFFRTFWKKYLDVLVQRLQGKGVEDTPYSDEER